MQSTGFLLIQLMVLMVFLFISMALISFMMIRA